MVQYSALSEALKTSQRQDFSVIFETIHKHYANYFDLEALDNEAEVLGKTYAQRGAYFTLCFELMQQLVDLYTEAEIIVKMDVAITSLLTRANYQKIFTPLIVKIKNDKRSQLLASPQQANFMAKLATDHLPRVTPLTPFDLICCAANMNMKINVDLNVEKDRFRIFERSHLAFLQPQSSQYLIINMNENPEKLARWVGVNTDKNIVYSEFLLYESEKIELQRFLSKDTLEYQHCNATHALSCGYAVIDWLSNQEKLNNFPQGAGFWKQRHSLLIYLMPIYYRSKPEYDNYSLYEPLVLPEQDKALYSEGFNYALNAFFLSLSGSLFYTQQAPNIDFIDIICAAANAGVLDGSYFEMHNLSQLLDCFRKTNRSWSELKKCNTAHTILAAPSFDTFFEKKGWLTETEGKTNIKIGLQSYNSVPSFVFDYHQNADGNKYNIRPFTAFLQEGYTPMALP